MRSCFADQASFDLPAGPPRDSQEQILHDVVIVGGAAVWKEAGGEDDDGVETFPIVPWEGGVL